MNPIWAPREAGRAFAGYAGAPRTGQARGDRGQEIGESPWRARRAATEPAARVRARARSTVGQQINRIVLNTETMKILLYVWYTNLTETKDS